ncbi:hypothetical protein LUZ63_017379 [Rhynchospora breviuscula]|uniref:LRAT domain-containing protein n=1 Tax=Rhynchospora breviuscula TaxID=2022672 RepID=A0A9Q0C2D9_9POAL|nr:hypothetical protein LUZ63_017379 [Rhynchospora breviuscula]
MKKMVEMQTNKIRIEELKPGDHIYSWRSASVYAHHGIYIGDHKAIHFIKAGGLGSSSSRFSAHNSACICQQCADALLQLPTQQTQAPSKGGVIISCLDTFLKGGDLYRYAYSVSMEDFRAQSRGGTCTTAPSEPPNLVLQRARFLLETNGFGAYNLLKNNCEDFAIYCKTSLVKKKSTLSRSGQVVSVGAKVVSKVAGRILGDNNFRAELGSMYCYMFDIGVRKDVVKVPVERLAEHIRS